MNTQSHSFSVTRIAFASFIGTTIEFYDFYIYGFAVRSHLLRAPIQSAAVHSFLQPQMFMRGK